MKFLQICWTRISAGHSFSSVRWCPSGKLSKRNDNSFGEKLKFDSNWRASNVSASPSSADKQLDLQRRMDLQCTRWIFVHSLCLISGLSQTQGKKITNTFLFYVGIVAIVCNKCNLAIIFNRYCWIIIYEEIVYYYYFIISIIYFLLSLLLSLFLLLHGC